MVKKLSLLLVAAAAAAFAVPAFAQAVPELTIGGVKATKGQTFNGTTNNWTMQGSLGKITCSSLAMHGVTSGNTGATVEVTDDTTSGNTKGLSCKSGANTIIVEHFTLNRLHTNQTGSGTFSLEFTTQIGAVHCKISTASSAFTYVSGASPLVITLTNVDLVATPAACEPATTSASFTVTSPSGVVVLH